MRPGVAAAADLAHAYVQVLQDLVRGIRNSRAEYGVDLRMRIPATLVIEDDALR